MYYIKRIRGRLDRTPKVQCSVFPSLTPYVWFKPPHPRKNNRKNKTGGRNKGY